MKKWWLFGFVVIFSPLFSHVYMNNCADRIGVANINIISISPLTSYYQAGVTNEGISTSISQPFQIAGVENGNISLSKNFRKMNISTGALYLFSDHYSMYSSYLNLNYELLEIISLGLSQKLISINETESYFETISDIGILISRDQTKLAINYTNLFNNKSNKLDIPNIISSEISYNPIKDTYLALGVEKEKRHKLSTKFGIRYRILSSLTLLSGYTLEPNQMFAGLSVSYKDFNITYAIATHPELDSTHQISLIYDF